MSRHSDSFESHFRGACVVVTGAASGIGRATARGFADAGAVVLLLHRDVDGLAATERELSGQAVRGDISIWADCLRLRDAVLARGAPLRALVNCAASFRSKGVDATPEDWDESLGVNVRGTWVMSPSRTARPTARRSVRTRSRSRERRLSEARTGGVARRG